MPNQSSIGERAKVTEGDLYRANQIQVMLMQALIGVITANFRMVSVEISNDMCKITTVLSQHDEEEAADLADELSILSEVRCSSEVVISASAIALPEPPGRVVFRRKES